MFLPDDPEPILVLNRTLKYHPLPAFPLVPFNILFKVIILFHLFILYNLLVPVLCLRRRTGHPSMRPLALTILHVRLYGIVPLGLELGSHVIYNWLLLRH